MSELTQETPAPVKALKVPVKYPKCTNGLCRCQQDSECHAHDDIHMVCSPKTWAGTCEARKKWEKLSKLFK